MDHTNLHLNVSMSPYKMEDWVAKIKANLDKINNSLQKFRTLNKQMQFWIFNETDSSSHANGFHQNKESKDDIWAGIHLGSICMTFQNSQEPAQLNQSIEWQFFHYQETPEDHKVL